MTLSEVIAEYYRKIYNFCLYYTEGDVHKAEDCTQQVFVLLLVKWNTVNDADVYKWLLKASYLELKNLCRKEAKHKRTVSFEDGEIMHSTPDPADIAISDEEIDLYKKQILDNLADGDRALYHDYFEQKMSYAEIAEKLGINYDTARMRVTRLRAKLEKKVLETFGISATAFISIKLIIALLGRGDG